MTKPTNELSADTRLPLSLRTVWEGGGRLVAIVLAIISLTAQAVRTFDRIDHLDRQVTENKAALDKEIEDRKGSVATLTAEDQALRQRQDKLEASVKDAVSAIRGDMASIRSDLRLLVTQVNLVVPAARRTPIQLPPQSEARKVDQ